MSKLHFKYTFCLSVTVSVWLTHTVTRLNIAHIYI